MFVVVPRGKLQDVEEDAEREMLRSSLWAALFRSGYTADNGLAQSLSGKQVCSEQAVYGICTQFI